MKKFFAVVLISTFVSAPAFADKSGMFYGAIDTGTVVMSDVNHDQFANPGSVSILAGYHFFNNLAVEGGYTKVSDSTFSSPLATGEATLSHSIWGVAAVGAYPVNESFDVFGKLGLNAVTEKFASTGGVSIDGVYNASFSATTVSLNYGIGAQYNFNRHIGLRAQYESLGKGKYGSASPGINLTRASIGAVYNF